MAFWCNLVLLVVGMSVSASPNYTTFIVLRFFTAIFTNGHFTSFYVLGKCVFVDS